MNEHPLIRDLPPSERPRERLRDYGANALFTAELRAIILRSGTARENVVSLATRLLARYEGLPGLARASFGALTVALELGKRLAAAGPEERLVITSARDVENLRLAEMGLLEQESLRALLLNTKNAVLTTVEVVRGSVNTAQVRTAEIFREAVRANAVALIRGVVEAG